jgi:RNA polymerase sigma factor (sigma-70 family)
VTRDEQILSVAPVVNRIARGLHRKYRLGNVLLVEDLQSYGWMGVIHAVDRDKQGTRTFEDWAGLCARNAIIAGIRDFTRYRRRVQAQLLSIDHEEFNLDRSQAFATTEAYDEQIDQATRLAMVMQAAERIDSREWDVLQRTMRATRSQVAQDIGMSRSRVDQLVASAKQAIRRYGPVQRAA